MGEPIKNSLWISVWDVDAMSKWRRPGGCGHTDLDFGEPLGPGVYLRYVLFISTGKKASPRREEREN